MKKLVLILSLIVMLPFQAHAAAYVAPVTGGVAGSTVPNFWLFTGALGFALTAEYLNIEGVSFPACGDNWLNQPQSGTKCYNEYPEAVHKDGV